MVAASDELMAALRAVRSLGLRSWCIGAGAIRSLVWDVLHGFDRRSAVEDLDVVYFDAKAGPEHDAGEWLSFEDAVSRLAWPRERRALEDIRHLLNQGTAGLLEDVLRIS